MLGTFKRFMLLFDISMSSFRKTNVLIKLTGIILKFSKDDAIN